jgi:hypothetical protein
MVQRFTFSFAPLMARTLDRNLSVEEQLKVYLWVTIAFSTTLSLANLLGYQGLKRQENWENHLAEPFL